MKILSLHCDYFKFKPLKKAIKSIGDLDEKEKKEVSVKEPLGIFVAVEKKDEGHLKNAIDELVENVLDLKSKVKAESIVLYPYAHLSNDLSSPGFAQSVLEGAEGALKNKKINVFRAPFGYYKEFELKCKGHPLSELSRELSFGADKQINISKKKGMEKQEDEGVDEKTGGERTLSVKKAEESYDPKQLLRQLSKSKLDTSKLKENDHRILGQRMDLFSFSETAPGMVFWHDKGWTIYNELVNYWKDEHRKAGYQEISTPQILDSKLWKISGHWEKYKDNIFLTGYEGREFAVKPMNCPGGMLVFKSSPKSYKQLPLKVAELGIVHRQELSGVLAGLFRVIKFTQDDAHIFCNEEQLEEEILKIIQLINKVYTKLGVKLDHLELSTRPEKRIGDEKLWDKAEKALESVLKNNKMKYKLNPGDGAFYGPKIDFHIIDSLNRPWQCGTIQLDFAMPERFELEYTDSDGKIKRPIMLHRTVLGSLERFLGVLLEHTNGNLPTWLSPVQVKVISFTDRNEKKAKEVAEKLKEEGIRVETDFESTTVGDKVRNAALMKIPYLITIGDKEEEKGTIALKRRGKDKPEFGIKLDDFLKELKEEIKERK